MPNMCKKSSERVRYVSKPNEKALEIKKKKYTINQIIATVRSRYQYLDKEYYELLDAQAFLMAKKFKLGSAEGEKDTKIKTFLNTEIKSENVSDTVNVKQEEVTVNQTRIELGKSLFIDDVEEEEDE